MLYVIPFCTAWLTVLSTRSANPETLIFAVPSSAYPIATPFSLVSTPLLPDSSCRPEISVLGIGAPEASFTVTISRALSWAIIISRLYMSLNTSSGTASLPKPYSPAVASFSRVSLFSGVPCWEMPAGLIVPTS